MVPRVLKSIMGYFKVSWIHGLGLGFRVEASIYLLWSFCVRVLMPLYLCFGAFVLSLWNVLVLIGSSMAFKESKEDNVKGFVFSYYVRIISLPNLLLNRLSDEQLPNSS